MTAALRLVKDDATAYELMRQGVPAAYETGARLFVDFLESGGYGLSYEGLQAYRIHLSTIRSGRRFSANTVNYYLAAAKDRIRAALERSEANLTVAEKYQIEQALKDVKGEKIASTKVDRDKCISHDQVKAFIAACPKKRIALFFEFLFYTGARISEATNLLLSDVKPGERYTEVLLHGKGSKQRIRKIDNGLLERIRAEFKGTVYLFESPHKRDGFALPYDRSYVSINIRRQAKRILGAHVTAHTLRHSFATHALARKGEGRIRAVQNALGHSSAATTINLYVHDDFSWDEEQELFS